MKSFPCSPDYLPIKDLEYSSLIKPLGEANRSLARYDGMIRGMVNPDVLLSPFILQEAVLSSRIEGTQATVDEVYEKEAGETFSQSREADIQEILNYRQALRYGSSSLRDRRISLSLIKEIHRLLLNGVRGSMKTPGLFRTEQNWIGPRGCTIEEASYIPPDPLVVEAYLDNWLAYIMEDHLDPLLQTAIMHAQFEIIHPFLDGNGRIGRLLIPLLLYAKGVLYRPMFYLSSYLERHRDRYYQLLNNIHSSGNWNEWILFFLQAIIEQSNENANLVRSVNLLHDKLSDAFRKITKSAYYPLILDEMFHSPIFTKSQMVNRLQDCNANTVRRLIDLLIKHGYVMVVRPGKGRRADLCQLPSLFHAASGKAYTLPENG